MFEVIVCTFMTMAICLNFFYALCALDYEVLRFSPSYPYLFSVENVFALLDNFSFSQLLTRT